jgi:DNA-binding CsgD family transcriptional regulator
VTEPTPPGRLGAPEEPAELIRIRHRLAEAQLGAGAVVYLEGPSAAGKTKLAMAAAEAARSTGMRVLAARGHPLERDFSFGVALQLLEETWLATGTRERATRLEGPARAAADLLSGNLPAGPALDGDHAYAVIHGLFWLVRGLAADATQPEASLPLALIVDDVDHADRLSLRFLAYLAARIAELPIALVLAARTVPSSADPLALGALRAASELLVLAPGSNQLVRSEGPRAVAAQAALRKSLGDGHRESVIDLAELAWGGGALLDSDEDADAWPLVANSLRFVDELERAAEIAQIATRSERPLNPIYPTHHCQGWSLYHQGQISSALALANATRAAQPDDQAVRALIAACRLAQGRFDEAVAVLPSRMDDVGVEELDAAVLLDVRAQLRLAQLRPTDALADALEAGRSDRGAWGPIGPGVVAWRSTAALAHLALGETERARALAAEELELVRERGLRRVIIRDLRVLAFAAKETRRLDLLGEAVKVGRAAPPRLEYVNALVDLGAATRRANHRTAARQPLREALELAERGGAAVLARRAQEELSATGARSRRIILSGIKALTPSERRVADLAAGGLTTRQIAQVLFVTPKTVEFHLRHVYRKLDIPSSRADLARALSPPSG